MVIIRLPQGQNVALPHSRCPKCLVAIKWRDNIPVLSYFLLRGKCRNCGTQISWRYPLVEFLMACLFAAIFYRWGWSISTFEYLLLAFGLVTVSFIDFDHMILPDSFTLGGIVMGLVGSYLNPDRAVMESLMGLLMGGGFLWAVAYVYMLIRQEEGMGGGDIKLLAWIGAVLGWQAIPFVILGSSIVGSLVGLTVAWQSKSGLKTSIPFGPYLAFAALVYVLGGQHFGQIYLNFFMPMLSTPN